MRRTICLNSMNMYRAILTSIYEKNRPSNFLAWKCIEKLLTYLTEKKVARSNFLA